MIRAAVIEREVVTQLPPKLMFLMELHPYKVAYGGRFGLKTRSFAIALLNLGGNQKLRILCCREVMGSEPLFVSEIGPVIGAHTGPGLLGVGGVPSDCLR